jgi:hypothetical protein
LQRVTALHHLTPVPAPCCPLCRYPAEALAGLADPTANIFVEKSIATGSELLARLQRLRDLLDQQRRRAIAAPAGASAGGAAGAAARPVCLLVVDSVAHVCRYMGDHVGVGELAGRTELLFKISALLRWVLLMGAGTGECWRCEDSGHSAGRWAAAASKTAV